MKYYSIYNIGSTVPVRANCPIKTLPLAKELYGNDSNFFIKEHETKVSINIDFTLPKE